MDNLFRHSYMLIVSVLLGLLLLMPAKVVAKDKISWYVTEWAPYNITRGKLKRKGINDRLILHIHQFLPDHEIEWRNMNPLMLNRAFTDGENICQLDLFKTPEREKIAYFSKYPAVIDAPLRLFIRAKDNDSMKLGTAVDLDKLLKQQQFKAAFVSSRSYSGYIDKILADHKGDNIKTEESTKRLIKQFFKGKTDYVVEYSAVMSYFKSMLKSKKDILSFPIENTQAYVLGYTACSKTLWGKTTIDKIDAILKDQRHTPQYKQILEQWHDPRSKSLIINNYHNF